MKVYLDFDGTVVEHAYPNIGKLNPGSFAIIKKLQSAGHELILNTYRSDVDDGSIKEAINYLNLNKEFKIEPILKRTKRKLDPPEWDLNRFIKNNVMYIDDICKGTPMRNNISLKNGKMVDWIELDKQLIEYKLY